MCRLVLATTESQREAVQIVLEEFFILTDSGWVNSRADSEIDAMRDKQQKQRDKANKRWHKPEAEPGNATASSEHATASKNDAGAMPPTPTPTPTPTPVVKEEGEPRKRSSAPVCPDFVDQQVWEDWLALRKAKKAPVTATVVHRAETEAHKAGMPLEDFLRVWCSRGSQGLEASWLKPDERTATAIRTQPQPKSFAQQEREAGWARWEQQTNRQHPDRLAYEARNGGGIVIDMQTATSQQSRISQ